jgi:hypothetical protein
MNTRVSFNLGKLLKNKGYEDTETCYNESGSILTLSPEVKYFYFLGEEFYPAPLIADVVMWLYEKHGIWISVDPENDTDTWFHTITHGTFTTVFGSYSTLTEAYEAGIEDVLINMI